MMKVISLIPGTKSLSLDEQPVPVIQNPDEVKVQVLEVGICGTDREEAAGGRADAPAGKPRLVIGHEMLGQVVEVGASVTTVRPGDYAVFTVRRGCGHCPACAMNRSDMCYSGDYTERGIKGRDGYDAEFVVDQEQYLVKVPAELGTLGVLAEPMSVAQKAIEEAALIQAARLPDAGKPEAWFKDKRVLVAGLGPIGLLAAFALRLRGANVLGLDVVDKDSPRPTLLKAIGGVYVNGHETSPEQLQVDHIDVILEATGVARLEFDLIEALGINGVYVLTGIPGGDRPIQIDGAKLMRQLVLRNQVIVGSVNASRHHFQNAVNDLQQARQTWGGLIDRVITDRLPYAEFDKALTQHTDDEIKTVLEWKHVP